MADRRVDPDDGATYSWPEFSAYYKSKYAPKAVKEYWETCRPVKKGTKPKAIGELQPSPKANAKAKAEPKKSDRKVEPKAAKLAPKYKKKSDCRVEQRLADLGIAVPTLGAPIANYVPFKISGKQVYISGQIAKDGDTLLTGKVGKDYSLEQAQAAARVVGINLIAQMKAATGGDLDRVKQVLSVQGFVNCTDDFVDHPKVVNGVSDLLVEVFGKEVGAHSRFAVGVCSLPLGVAVEAGAVIEIQ